MKRLVHAGIMLAICACVTACAGPEESSIATAATPRVRAQEAANAITVGKSTKAEVIVALGKTTVVTFDSGFEVWVYRYKRGVAAGSAPGTTAITELVILLAPSGVVTKTRIRTASPAA
jgi:outer membrane protein assembly factor BamE (lipoprotein component of BamABCDE complex)